MAPPSTGTADPIFLGKKLATFFAHHSRFTVSLGGRPFFPHAKICRSFREARFYGAPVRRNMLNMPKSFFLLPSRSPQFSQKIETLALPRGMHSLHGGSLTTFPVNLHPHIFLSALGDARARAPNAPPGYAYAGDCLCPNVKPRLLSTAVKCNCGRKNNVTCTYLRRLQTGHDVSWLRFNETYRSGIKNTWRRDCISRSRPIPRLSTHRC